MIKHHLQISFFSLMIVMLTISQISLRAATPEKVLPAIEEYTVRVYGNVSAGAIKHGLAGVSQGGNANSYLKEGVVSGVRNLGIRAVRLESVTQTKNYNLYDPAANRYDWSAMDREIEAIQGTGAEIILNIFCTPKWLSSDPNGKFWAAEPADWDRWAQYVKAIVTHVNVEKKYNIRYWEIWNEPTNPGFWAPAKNGLGGYCKLYDVTARAIKEADSSALIGGFGDNMAWPDNFTAFFNYVAKNNLPLDFITVHWYADWNKTAWNQPSVYDALSRQVQTHHRAVFGRDVPIFLTEWNFTAEKEAYTALQHSAYIASSLYWMQESPLEIAMLFRVEPYKKTLGSVLDARNQVRGPGRVLQMFSTLPADRLPVYDAPANVQILAARNKKSLHLLISRYDAAPGAEKVLQKLNLKILNHGLAGDCVVRINNENNETGDTTGPTSSVETSISIENGKPVSLTVTLGQFSVSRMTIEQK